MTAMPRRFGVVFWVAAGFLAILTLGAVFAELLPLKDPTQSFRGTARNGPSWEFLLGNDGVGRDILSRLVYGARVSLLLSAVGAGVSLLIGGLIGVAAGYYGGRVDRYVTALLNGMLVVPGLVLFIALILFLDPDAENRIFVLIVAFVLLATPPTARVVRSVTVSWVDREFVLAARTMGARPGRVMFREVVPNVVPSLVSYSLIVMAQLIVAEGAVAFLGMSVSSPTPAWGDMINKGRTSLAGAAHVSLIPAAAMVLTVLALNFVGDRLQERFDPRQSVL